MILLDKQQRIKLRDLYESGKIDVILSFLDNLQDVLSKAGTVGETEYETLQKSFQRDYQMTLIDEIKRLLQEEAGSMGVEE